MVRLTYVKGFLLQDTLMAFTILLLCVVLLYQSIYTYQRFMRQKHFFNEEVLELYETKRIYTERDANSVDDNVFDIDTSSTDHE